MRTVAKEIGTREVKLGTINFPVFDSLEEMIETFGKESVMKLTARALNIDTERIARDAMKAKKTLAEAQAAVTNYKPGGVRSGKPNMKALMGLLTEFGEAGQIETMLKAQKLNKDDGVEAAHAYLSELKANGALSKPAPTKSSK